MSDETIPKCGLCFDTGLYTLRHGGGVQVPCKLCDAHDKGLHDANVEAVRDQLKCRAAKGLSTYGVTTERDDIDLMGWLQHLQEELLDAAVYIERTNKEIR